MLRVAARPARGADVTFALGPVSHEPKERDMKRTKIICTLGPAVDDEGMLRGLIEAGMDVARLNFSHGTHEEHAARIARFKRVREQMGSPCALMLDTKGPEIRTGMLVGGGPVRLERGSTLVLTDQVVEGTPERVTQTCPGLSAFVGKGDRILLDDGLIALRVLSLEGPDIVCEVENSGNLGQRKSVNLPGTAVPLPALTEQDEADLLFGIEQGVDFVAASFVRGAEGVAEIRAFLDGHGGSSVDLIAKIESAEAVLDIERIVRVSDGVMVARGDLGVEVDPWRVPRMQKDIIRMCNRESKPVVTATQMLDSMIRNPRPTRAEVADVANAIYDGTDCLMLSGETAAGAYPLEATALMARIAEESEAALLADGAPDRSRFHVRPSLAVGLAAVQTAETLDAACIVAPTMSGRTARLISKLRPRVPIYAVTPSAQVMRHMQVSWGVVPLHDEVRGSMQRVISDACKAVHAHGFAAAGDIAVVTAGDPDMAPMEERPSGASGIAPTNVLKVVQM